LAQTIVPAATAADFAEVAALIGDYVGWCRKRYADEGWLVDAAFGHQSLDTELASGFPAYRPPAGATLIARHDDKAIGCIAYRRRSRDVCEMKRLFVRQSSDTRGVGRRLCEALIGEAVRTGYAQMCLDTLSRFSEAIGLYRSLGFRECEPYQSYLGRLMPHLVFMQRPLAVLESGLRDPTAP
jgi:GNAT superfamily N-acetyltransferase